MVDTGFVVPEKDHGRLVAYYAGADLMEPMKPGLTRTDDAPFPSAYLRPIARLRAGLALTQKSIRNLRSTLVNRLSRRQTDLKDQHPVQASVLV